MTRTGKLNSKAKQLILTFNELKGSEFAVFAVIHITF